MLNKEYALMQLFDVAPVIKGRKRFQKVVYLLQQIGVPYSEKFRYYHYGPYSSELQVEIDNLVNYELVNESYTGETYVYEITDKGTNFSLEYNALDNRGFRLPRQVVKQIIDTDTPVLELASTYAYLLEMGYKRAEAVIKATELKPHLQNRLDEAINLFEDISKTNIS